MQPPARLFGSDPLAADDEAQDYAALDAVADRPMPFACIGRRACKRCAGSSEGNDGGAENGLDGHEQSFRLSCRLTAVPLSQRDVRKDIHRARAWSGMKHLLVRTDLKCAPLRVDSRIHAHPRATGCSTTDDLNARKLHRQGKAWPWNGQRRVSLCRDAATILLRACRAAPTSHPMQMGRILLHVARITPMQRMAQVLDWRQ